MSILYSKVPSGVRKVDLLATNGLVGVSNSLAYRVHEIERHLHSAGSWFGEAATPSATNLADRIGPGIAPFELDAGNNDWGAWAQIFGSADTPARTGQAYFDPHLILIVDAEEAVPYFIQFARGASGEAGYSAGTFTEFVVGVDATKKFKAIMPIQTGRAPVGSLIWARCLAYGENTGTLHFYIGIHEYAG